MIIYSGQGHKLINLVVHHCAGGPSAWSNARDVEVYGCLVFNNGWDAPAGREMNLPTTSQPPDPSDHGRR